MRKLVVLVVLLSLLAGVAIGCGEQFQGGTFTDDAGREVTINEMPERIVSFGPSITEILFALGLGDRVVGVSDYSDYPAEAQEIPSIGNAYSPSIEILVELEPDLVLTLEHAQLNSQLEALGLTYLILSPTDIGGIFANIELVGAVTGAVDEAAALISDMQSAIDNIVAIVEGAPTVSVFYIVDASLDVTMPWTAGEGSFIDALITMAGGENIAHDTPGEWLQFSIEEVVSADPDFIIIQTMIAGVPTVTIETLEAHPIWGSMRAVIEGNVFIVDGDLVSRPGPRIVQGLEELARILHPELFE
jgi:iron complex transport system substrate-binding protein